MSDKIRVHSYKIIGTKIRVYAAWEPTSPGGGHTTVSFGLFPDDERQYGTVTSRGLPPEITALPGGSPERINAVLLYQTKLNAIAFNAITAVHPELKTDPQATFTHGRFEVVET